jgi:hypothetical protein
MEEEAYEEENPFCVEKLNAGHQEPKEAPTFSSCAAVCSNSDQRVSRSVPTSTPWLKIPPA